MGRLVQIYESVYALSTGKAIPESLIINDARILLKDLQERSKAFPDEYKQPKYAGIFPAGLWQSIESGRELESVPEFTINREGEVINAHILKYSHSEFANEALRIVKSMPKAVPAMSEGSPVACNYVLYIPFRPTLARH